MSNDPPKFSTYHIFVIAVLTFLQFTVVLDFMILSPLGAILMPELEITTKQFGKVVSAYAFSAGASGFLAAGFADRYDRKSLLLFFYVGFILGTFFCGIAENYETLLAARIVTGMFGGVINSIILAITSDVFSMNQRGRVLGNIQSAFAGSQVLGIPLALYLATNWGWHTPFFLIVILGFLSSVIIYMYLRPINKHLEMESSKNPLIHLWHTLINPNFTLAFLAMALISTGGFMIMPFSSAFTVANLKINITRLPIIYLTTGLANIFIAPLIGKAADRYSYPFHESA